MFFEMSGYNFYLDHSVFINKRIERCFFSLKTNKSPSAVEVNFVVLLSTYLFYHYKMKIVLVSPVFKTGDISNYRPISALPCFSEILERLNYNRLYKNLTDRKYYTHNSLASEKATIQNMQLLSL